MFQLKAPVQRLRQTKTKNPAFLALTSEFEGLIGKPVQKKLEWLLRFSHTWQAACALTGEQGANPQPLLPLPRHQAYGSFFYAVKRMRLGVNPKTGGRSSGT